MVKVEGRVIQRRVQVGCLATNGVMARRVQPQETIREPSLQLVLEGEDVFSRVSQRQIPEIRSRHPGGHGVRVEIATDATGVVGKPATRIRFHAVHVGEHRTNVDLDAEGKVSDCGGGLTWFDGNNRFLLLQRPLFDAAAAVA